MRERESINYSSPLENKRLASHTNSVTFKGSGSPLSFLLLTIIIAIVLYAAVFVLGLDVPLEEKKEVLRLISVLLGGVFAIAATTSVDALKGYRPSRYESNINTVNNYVQETEKERTFEIISEWHSPEMIKYRIQANSYFRDNFLTENEKNIEREEGLLIVLGFLEKTAFGIFFELLDEEEIRKKIFYGIYDASTGQTRSAIRHLIDQAIHIQGNPNSYKDLKALLAKWKQQEPHKK